MKEWNSQRVRALAPENDPLKLGMGWTAADLEKPQIMVESTFGDSHPGSAHLNQFVEEAMRGIKTREEEVPGIILPTSAMESLRDMTELTILWHTVT